MCRVDPSVDDPHSYVLAAADLVDGFDFGTILAVLQIEQRIVVGLAYEALEFVHQLRIDHSFIGTQICQQVADVDGGLRSVDHTIAVDRVYRPRVELAEIELLGNAPSQVFRV